KLHYRSNFRGLVILRPEKLHFCNFVLLLGFYLPDASRRGVGVKRNFGTGGSSQGWWRERIRGRSPEVRNRARMAVTARVNKALEVGNQAGGVGANKGPEVRDPASGSGGASE
ncbi:hypothetical protein, partial [Paenibacillus cisolokensis]|uniref:hypothetical protein n=1 Tax=Paenibacillus cisolokensis TaxID=1658519 RepID=UPI001BCBA71D